MGIKTATGTWLGHKAYQEAEGDACGKPEDLEFQAELPELHIAGNKDGVGKVPFKTCDYRNDPSETGNQPVGKRG